VITRLKGWGIYDPPAALSPPTVLFGAVCLRLEAAEGGQERRSAGLETGDANREGVDRAGGMGVPPRDARRRPR
jgi:hypothetical protein